MVSWSKVLGLASVAAATALLGMVAFDVPYFKQVYFLRIDLQNGTVTSGAAANQTQPFVDLGVLGFCTDLKDGNGLQCSKAHIGYNLSEASNFLNVPNTTTQQVNADGQNATVSVPLPPALTNAVSTVASGLTKALVLHIVAFGISMISFAFALMAFFGAPIADCCSSCFCGFAGAAAFAVFIFDIAFFELIKKRVQDVSNLGGAAIGPAIYLTLFAWLLLFITPLLFLLGRCCACCMPDMSSHHNKRDKERY